MGYGHKTKKELLEQNSISSFNDLIGQDRESLTLILDGTYLFVEKPSEFKTQWLLYSGQKKRHLVKPMMVVTSNGYILEAAGLYGADGHNNDAGILTHMTSGKIIYEKYKVQMFTLNITELHL